MIGAAPSEACLLLAAERRVVPLHARLVCLLVSDPGSVLAEPRRAIRNSAQDEPQRIAKSATVHSVIVRIHSVVPVARANRPPG